MLSIKEFIVICPYCNELAGLESNTGKGKHVAKYVCPSCGAEVAAHNCDKAPMGVLGNKELRALRIETHKVFDTFCNSQNMSRSQGYEWLATKLKLQRANTHFGMFTYDELQKAKKLLERNIKK